MAVHIRIFLLIISFLSTITCYCKASTFQIATSSTLTPIPNALSFNLQNAIGKNVHPTKLLITKPRVSDIELYLEHHGPPAPKIAVCHTRNIPTNINLSKNAKKILMVW